MVYVQVGQQTIADYGYGVAATTPKYNYVYASYIDEPEIREEPSASEILYFHRNQQYSIVALTDDSGGIVERYAYSAYGESVLLSGAGSAISTSPKDERYTFTGREWDFRLSLFHFRDRLQSARIGGFLSRDRLGYWASKWSLFGFCSVSPPARTDPSGNSVIEIMPAGSPSREDAIACCKDYWNNQSHPQTLRGWVMCCQCKHILCSAVEKPTKKPRISIEILHECAFAHERTHLDDVGDCRKSNCENQCYRNTNWKPGKDREQEECRGYAAEMRCLSRRFERCKELKEEGDDAGYLKCHEIILEKWNSIRVHAINEHSCAETDSPDWNWQ